MITHAGNKFQTRQTLATLSRRLHQRERTGVINLIASDNAVPDELVRNPLYSGFMIQEGLLGNRPFAGADIHDEIEKLGAEIACSVFEAEHANLQPHSCSQANQAAYHALLQPNDTVLSLDFFAGGHLTHGLKSNFSGKSFNFFHYGLNDSQTIDYDTAAKLAIKVRPKLIVCGSSAYPRLFDAHRLRSIADEVGAYLMFDLSHEAGLIAAGVIPNIIRLADVATMSVDKTLRGPFGGLILCKKPLSAAIDSGVHPGSQSSFSVRSIVDKANAILDTQSADFSHYASKVLSFAKVFERAFDQNCLITGGTDKHYVILDTAHAFGLSGLEAEQRLEKIGVLCNRQSLPTDTSKNPTKSNGVRLGVAWVASRGYDILEVERIAKIISRAFTDESCLQKLKEECTALAVRKRKNDVWNDT